MTLASPSPVALSWLLSALHSAARVVSDLGRLVQLLVMLAPLVCWGPLAFHYGFRRQQWIRHLRCLLSALLLPCRHPHYHHHHRFP